MPAGGALAVDREVFGQYITNKVKTHPNIEVIENTEITELNFDEITIVATGPLTSGKLAEEIASLTGENYCYFYDAAAPIVTGESLDWNKVYRASRYGKGDADYVNCPFNEEEYKAFWEALTTAEEAPTKDFEKQIFFEGCMPIEVMAKRGIDTMRYGPMKPVGLDHPETGAKAYAVVQLRQDNAAATLYNIVGFQTHLKWPEQQRVFRMIPGLENAEFVRLGVMHRNTYIHSPKVLCETLQLKGRPRLFFAGQITGVEGYVESAASGLMAGINAARLARGEEPLIFPEDTAHGALSHYITHAEGKNFQPMNVNFGLLPPLGQKIRDKKVKNKMIADRALESLEKFKVFRQ